MAMLVLISLQGTEEGAIRGGGGTQDPQVREKERFRAHGSGFRVQGSGFMIQGSCFKVQGSGLRVQG